MGANKSVKEEQAQELHKSVIKKLKRRIVYVRFRDNIWAADLAEIGLLSSENRGVELLLCVIDVFNKYGWVKLLKDKKAKTVLNSFIRIVNKSNVNQVNYGLIKGNNFIIALNDK